MIIGMVICSPALSIQAQIANDDCGSAIELDLQQAFCSTPRDFNNIMATASVQTIPTCWNMNDGDRDVWYSFKPRQSGALIQLFGETDRGVESLDNAAIAIYSGNCANLTLVLCTNVSVGREDLLERTLANLQLGSRYYIRVSSSAASVGTFQLCVSTFTTRPNPEQDCPDAVILCDKSSFNVERLLGGGRDDDEAFGTCLSNPQSNLASESSSTWYKWTARTSGSLTFTLTPNNFNDPEEDLDFVVFRLPNGIDNCNNKEVLRCMASGETAGLSAAQNARCFGPTGLRDSARDFVETSGCSPGDDNFLAPLDMIAGESYALMINNFSNSGQGFSITFGGSGTFEGPNPAFEVQSLGSGLACDNLLRLTDITINASDPITDYQWTFGEDASQTTASGQGPHQVSYSSQGTKIASLTVTTSRGCSVTQIQEINIGSCCDEANNSLTLEADIRDLTCYDSGDGFLTIRAGSGSPLYLYSINGANFTPNDRFTMLDAGNYTITVQDRKGCELNRVFEINEPEEMMLFLMRALDTVPLGFGTSLSSEYTPSDRIVTYTWTPIEILSCTDCPDPNVTPPGTTTYTLTIVDQDGCTTSADITIFTTDDKPFYAPNAIYRGSTTNGRFKIFSNIAVSEVEKIVVYDRWGNMLYEEENFDINSPFYIGWDGTINGQELDPGIYVWVAKVRFVDNEVTVYSGDFTIFD